MGFRVARRQLNGLLPRCFGTNSLTGLCVQLRQKEICLISIISPIENDVQFGCLAHSNHVAGVAPEDMFILVKRWLPLLRLHVTKPQPTTRRCVFWELCQCSLILSCCICPLAIPAIAIGCVHCCAEDLSVPRHERFTS